VCVVSIIVCNLLMRALTNAVRSIKERQVNLSPCTHLESASYDFICYFILVNNIVSHILVNNTG